MILALLSVAGIVLGGMLVMYGIGVQMGWLTGLGFIILALSMIVGLYVPGGRRDSGDHLVAEHDHDSGTTH